jgi:hypothetical protein
MKVGDLVRPIPGEGAEFRNKTGQMTGIVLEIYMGEPVVYWNLDFPREIEYEHQLEVISESR